MFFSLEEVAEMLGTTKQNLSSHAFRGNLQVTHFRCTKCRTQYARGYITPQALEKFREYLKEHPGKKLSNAFGNENVDLEITQEEENGNKLRDVQAAEESNGGGDEGV